MFSVFGFKFVYLIPFQQYIQTFFSIAVKKKDNFSLQNVSDLFKQETMVFYFVSTGYVNYFPIC